MGRLSLNPESFPQIYNFFFKKVIYETTGEGEHCGRVILMNDNNFVGFFLESQSFSTEMFMDKI